MGRRHELAEIRDLLSSTRILTLTGGGGVGKTRLALRVADQVRRGFPDGVVLVELAEVRDAALVPHAVALALGFRDETLGWTVENLAERLADQHVLLVLDNCEHLIVACALLVRHILAQAPEVHVLSTSREALRIGGETTYSVPPLGVPTWTSDSRARDLAQYDGVQLFLDRARARLPGFALTEINAPHVAQICERVDGLPLAIELAAERVRALPVEQINARLSSRLRLLTRGDRSASLRHQTLLASIMWSYDLCADEEKLVWARVSVFPSSFVLTAAERVCADEDLELDRVFDLLSDLVDKSVLVREEDAGPEARYRMPGALREFGNERLEESGHGAVVRERMVDWCSRLAHGYRDGWFGPGQREWSARLKTEHQNLSSALGFALEGRDPSRAMSIASDINTYWVTAGLLSEGRHWLRRGVAESEPGTPGRATAQRWLAYFSFYLGDFTVVPRIVADARAELGPEPDEVDVAYLLLVEGMAALHDSDAHRAQTLLRDALRLFDRCDDAVGRAHALLGFGVTQWLCGDLASAQALLQECLIITSRHGESTLQSSALMNLGLVVWDAGESAEATLMELEALRLKVADDELIGQAMCMSALAWFSVTDDPRRGATLAGCADATWKRGGVSIESVRGLSDLRDKSHRELRARLPEQVLASCIDAGANLTSSEALALAAGTQEVTNELAENPKGFEPLTRREWQVAQHVTAGLANRQIASRLAISPRTVDAHVAHVLEKLAFTKRAQIAAWASERQRARS